MKYSLTKASESEILYQTKRWVNIKKTSLLQYNALFDNDCLLWTGSRNKQGYGQCRYKGKSSSSHRISWMIKNKLSEIPKHDSDGNKMEIRHLCNVSSCMEPSHLVIGTSLQNGKDKRASDNLLKGENHPNSKINKETARKIKWSKLERSDPNFITKEQRAKLFNVSFSLISSIDRGRTWSHIPDKHGNISRKAANKKLEGSRITRRKSVNIDKWTLDQWETAKHKLLNNKKYSIRDLTTKLYKDTHCRKWLGHTKNGYPRININGAEVYGHILSCMIGNNNVRPDALYACHGCGYSLCIEPCHLYFGTARQNSMDKHKHSTMPTKLNASQVIKIREEYEHGDSTYEKIGKKYNVSYSTIHSVVKRKTWSHIRPAVKK